MPNKKDLLVIDIEATCCGPHRSKEYDTETIEIGAVIFDTISKENRVQFESLIKPIENPILTGFCTKLTGITQSDVNNALPFEQAFDELIEWAEPFRPWKFCSWGIFDDLQLKKDCKRYDIEWPLGKHLDLAKVFRGNAKRSTGHRGAMKHFGLKPVGKWHRGLDDTLNICEIIKVMLEKEWLSI